MGALGLLSGPVAVSWPDLLRAAHDRPLAEGSGILVIVTLYGGNDGINTVIPYADNVYHDARPELAYAQPMSCTWMNSWDSIRLCAAWPSCGPSGSWRSCAA